jgi:hypothetical protein
MTTSEQGAIEMAAGHVYFTAVNGGPRYHQINKQEGLLHLLLKEILWV